MGERVLYRSVLASFSSSFKSRRVDESDLEADVDHVAVAHHVVAAFESELAGLFDLHVGPVDRKILVADNFGADEPARDIGVDHAGGVERRLASAQRPCVRLGLTGSVKSDQPEMI